MHRLIAVKLNPVPYEWMNAEKKRLVLTRNATFTKCHCCLNNIEQYTSLCHDIFYLFVTHILNILCTGKSVNQREKAINIITLVLKWHKIDFIPMEKIKRNSSMFFFLYVTNNERRTKPGIYYYVIDPVNLSKPFFFVFLFMKNKMDLSYYAFA